MWNDRTHVIKYLEKGSLKCEATRPWKTSMELPDEIWRLGCSSALPDIGIRMNMCFAPPFIVLHEVDVETETRRRVLWTTTRSELVDAYKNSRRVFSSWEDALVALDRVLDGEPPWEMGEPY